MSSPKSSWKMTDMSASDRCWLVAGLTLAGVTAQDIADRLSCSLRLVRTIRAEDMTQVCFLAQQREAALADEVRKTELAHRLTTRELAEANTDMDRLRLQLDQIIDAHVAGTLSVFPRCGHPKVGYNVYEHGGRTYCRECRGKWDKENRKTA